MVRIRRSHRRGRGSIPRLGEVLLFGRCLLPGVYWIYSINGTECSQSNFSSLIYRNIDRRMIQWAVLTNKVYWYEFIANQTLFNMFSNFLWFMVCARTNTLRACANCCRQRLHQGLQFRLWLLSTAETSTRDSSVGRAGDCSRRTTVISRSAVRLRLAGCVIFFRLYNLFCIMCYHVVRSRNPMLQFVSNYDLDLSRSWTLRSCILGHILVTSRQNIAIF